MQATILLPRCVGILWPDNSDIDLAQARLSREKATNPAFETFLQVRRLPWPFADLADTWFVQAFTRRPLTRRHDMLHYQTRITVRLQRYILLLQGILKKTPEDNLDRLDVQRALELLNAQCRLADEGVASAQLRLECRRYENDIVERPGTNYVRVRFSAKIGD